jgi:DNA-3-methyladenine glycosylase
MVSKNVSAGLLLFRRREGKIELLLGHPGGPFWGNRDDGAWTIPKGLIRTGEDESAAALREFCEETGHRPPGLPVSLGEARQPGGKLVKIWAIEGDWDPATLESNTFQMTWPPRSHEVRSFPELNKARWFAASAAKKKILKGQAIFIDRLLEIVEEAKPSSEVLHSSFFKRPAAIVARELIGKTLVRVTEDRRSLYTVTETEAYEGVHDLASHSAKGRTARTEVMFGPAGRFYVYRIYGLHWMLNVVTGEQGEGAAILIRGLDGVSGPGRVAAALEVDASMTGKEASPATGLWFEKPPVGRRVRVTRTPRIGIDYAGPIWAAKKLRFVRSDAPKP